MMKKGVHLKLSQVKFSVLDTETTGATPGVDKPIELAFVYLQNGIISTPYSWFIDPQMRIPPESSAVHHLTDEDIQGAPTIDILWPEVEPLLENTVIVAHNKSFDLSMLPQLNHHKSICTLRFSRHIWERGHINPQGFPLANHQQQVLRYWLKLKIDTGDLGAHRAAADIIVTAELLKVLINEYLSCGGEDDLDALIEFIESPIEIKKMPIGKKYKDALISDIPTEYLQYVMEMDSKEPIDPDLKSSIKRVLDTRKATQIIEHRNRN